MLAWVAVFTEDGLRRLWRGPSGDGADCAGVARAVFTGLHDRHNGIDELHRSMYIDTKAWLPEDLLMKVDKMSMAASVEARCPFLDHHVVEFVSGIPTAVKVNRGVSKFLLKQVAAKLLPAAIVSRPKHTFDVPVERWLTGGLRELVLDVMSDGVVPASSLFARGAVDRLWNEVQAGRPGAARQLWSLTTLGVWASRYKVAAG
jgi:asparagine synthase (glutamine-hydrolysing)